jgi:glycosyltransferase involved in cell wall biosynthesis
VGGIERVVGILVKGRVGTDRACAHGARTRSSYLDDLLSFASITRTVLRLPADDVVHAHLSQGGSFVREGWALVLAHTRGIATVATIHGSRFISFAGAHPRLVRQVLVRADRITCLSEDAKSLIESLVPQANVRVLPNPVPPDPNPTSASRTPETVLFAGELSERKGVDVLCLAWPLVVERHPAASCILVGPSTSLEIPKLDRMTVLSPIPPDEVGSLIRAARVIVLPSRNEGMPMILTEAMSLGRPFVSTPVGGIPQLANDQQPLVPVGDHVALAARLVEFLGDPLLAEERGEQGRAFYRQTRSLEVIGATLRSIYEEARLSNRERSANRAWTGR